jgi:hypothetical protein
VEELSFRNLSEKQVGLRQSKAKKKEFILNCTFSLCGGKKKKENANELKIKNDSRME